jgi:hypothetical protein
MSGCGVNGGISQSAARGTPGPGLQRTLVGARLMSMYAVEGNPARRATNSKPKTPYAIDSFRVNYVGP